MLLPTPFVRRTVYSPEALKLFAAFTVAANHNRRRLYDDLIVKLKRAGIWGKLDCLYLFAAHDSGAALINIKNPGTFNATLTNAPTFAADRGFTGNGTSDLIDSNFNATTATSPKYVRDSAHLSFWDRTNATTAAFACGTGNSSLRAKTGGNVIGSKTNNASEVTSTETFASDSTGFYLGNRDTSSTQQLYRNAVALTITPAASTALPNATHTWCGGGGQFSNHQTAMGSLGSSLSAAEVSAFYAALLVYMQAVGAA